MRPPDDAERRPPIEAAAQTTTCPDEVEPDGNPVDALIASYVGQQVPGGCDYCDAYQTVRDEIMPVDIFPAAEGIEANGGGWSIVIHHDDGCPYWIRYQMRLARRQAVARAKSHGNRAARRRAGRARP